MENQTKLCTLKITAGEPGHARVSLSANSTGIRMTMSDLIKGMAGRGKLRVV